MKIIFPILFLAMVAYVGWPYVNLFRLDRALISNDQQTLNVLVDLEAIKAKRKEQIEQQFRTGEQHGGMISGIVQEGARLMGSATVESVITMDWVREKLRWYKQSSAGVYPSIITDTGYAFFESPTIFLIRIGELGLNPVHLRMKFKDWHWRVIEIYD